VEIVDPAAEAARILDPGSAVETIYWGRNYLYSVLLETSEGTIPAVVKQFRNQGARERLERRLKGSKALRSWRIAVPMWAAGQPTPQPLMLVESRQEDGPSLFVTRQLPEVTEARYLFRALRAGTLATDFPDLDVERLVDDLGRTIRSMHDAGFWHRDLSIGNVLLEGHSAAPPLWILDLNRARQRDRVTVSQRTRDLCRLGFPERDRGDRFLSAYWGSRRRGFGFKRWLYRLYRAAYLVRVEGKKTVRDAIRSLAGVLFQRKPHAHIPEAPQGAGARDKAVWDYLSDQPHQHASRGERLRVRLADFGEHARSFGTATRAIPRARRRYRELIEELWREPVAWPGIGVAVGPRSAPPGEILAGLDDLGATQVLMRLHPWEEDHDESEELARELASRGVELTFAVPQVRELVREPRHWRAAVNEIAVRFVRYGNRFQIGQAINRSKWGIWNYREYAEMATIAADCLRAAGDVELLAPAVIDFEPYAMVAALNHRDAPEIDIASSLLYVDRRGAPENSQLGYDGLGKAALMRAIGETARRGAARFWITEVNWPLWEGPHSPAGKTVSVDEQTQADYLVRYFIPVLASGLAERAFWWQLVARGYGLIDRREDVLRRRPSYQALQNLIAQLEGTTARGPVPSPPGTLAHRFTHPDRGELLVAWSVEAEIPFSLPQSAERAISRDGEDLDPAARQVMLTNSPQYLWLRSSQG
jgi:tRNA A-37 threonylcarbamoyl transferase component Bud32